MPYHRLPFNLMLITASFSEVSHAVRRRKAAEGGGGEGGEDDLSSHVAFPAAPRCHANAIASWLIAISLSSLHPQNPPQCQIILRERERKRKNPGRKNIFILKKKKKRNEINK